MKDIKNYIIALLSGLLVLTLSVQYFDKPRVKAYDAVKVVQYDRCLDLMITQLGDNPGLWKATGKNPGLLGNYLDFCERYKP
jgi:hypothetical protein